MSSEEEELEVEFRCEAGTVDYSGPDPVIKKCGAPAKLFGWAALCEQHENIPRIQTRTR